MLTQGEDVEAHALSERGWSISAIARHLGRDRKTVRSYLNSERQPGVRVASVVDPLAEFEVYIRARFVDDPHLWASSLFVEVVALGYARSYPSFVRQVRQRGLRPHCEACRGVKGRDTIEIEHPPGEEIQWDWFERRRAPWGGTAFVLLGTLPHSSRTRGVLAESLDQAHLVEAMHAVMRRLGGTARIWRTDRLATVIVPGSRDVQPSFAPVAKHYGAIVEPCPPRRGNRKGRGRSRGPLRVRPLVAHDDRDHTRGSAGVVGPLLGRPRRRTRAPHRHRRAHHRRCPRRRRAAPAAAGCGVPGDDHCEPDRRRERDGGVPREPLRRRARPGRRDRAAAPSPRHGDTRDPLDRRGHAGRPPSRATRCRHHRAQRRAARCARAGRAVRVHHRRPCDRKANRPPGVEALAAAAALLGNEGRAVVVDLAVYAALADGSAS